VTWITWTLIDVLADEAVAIPAGFTRASKGAKGVVTSGLYAAEIKLAFICIFASHTIALESLDALTFESEEGISTFSEFRTVVFFENAFVSGKRNTRIGNSSISTVSFGTKTFVRSIVVFAFGGVIAICTCDIAV